LRNIIPTTTVPIHTPNPVGVNAVGRRHARVASQKWPRRLGDTAKRDALGVAASADRAEHHDARDVDEQRDGHGAPRG
jgi:hypothetical protein